MLPRLSVNEGTGVMLAPTSEEMISKLMSRPLALLMMVGWDEVIVKSLAAPKPRLRTRRPRAKGTGGSTTLVNGSWLYTSCCRK